MKKILIGLLVLLFGYGVPSMAQKRKKKQKTKAKIAFINSDYILSLLPEMEEAQRDIAAFERERSIKLNAMRQGLNIQAAQLQQVQDSLSDTVRVERETDLQLLQQDIAQEQRTAEQQLQFKEIQVLSPLRQRVDFTIDSVAQANSYNYVFEDNLDGQLILFYTEQPEESDLTPLVLKALNITAPADTTGTGE